MWVYCLGVCWTKLPGLVGAIVLTLRCTAVAVEQFEHPCTYNVHHTSIQAVKE